MTSKETSTLPLPPGNLGLPILGETISFFRDGDFNRKRQAKYGKIYKTSIFGRPNVVMVGAEANSFLFKHETLTSAIASFCLLTAQHPDVSQRLREEQKQLNLSDSLTLEDIKQMTYLEQVIKEVMRIIPAVGGGFREVIETFEFGGYSIPKGWTVQYQIAQTHKDSEIYTDSDRFDRDRFCPERQKINKKTLAIFPLVAV